MRALAFVPASVLLLAVSGCAKPDPVASNARSVNLPLPANDTAPDPAGAPPENRTEVSAASSSPAASPAPAIPAALQGRWGLTPADCTSTRGDAKGLLVVTADELRFYESRALPSANVQADAASVGGDFHFTGEGETWTKFEALKRSGDKLTRTETNPAASYTYAKC
jgi:hypothetical protein